MVPSDLVGKYVAIDDPHSGCFTMFKVDSIAYKRDSKNTPLLISKNTWIVSKPEQDFLPGMRYSKITIDGQEKPKVEWEKFYYTSAKCFSMPTDFTNVAIFDADKLSPEYFEKVKEDLFVALLDGGRRQTSNGNLACLREIMKDTGVKDVELEEILTKDVVTKEWGE